MSQASLAAPPIIQFRLVHEHYAGETYAFYPLGEHVVVAPAICGGRPTFKYTRLEVSLILARVASGDTIQQVVDDYAQSSLTTEAVSEAIQLANRALLQSWQTLHPAA